MSFTSTKKVSNRSQNSTSKDYVANTTQVKTNFDPFTRFLWYQKNSASDRFGFLKIDSKTDYYTSSSQHNLKYDLPKNKLLEREAKWFNMIDNWDLWMSNDREFEKVRVRCQKGIPNSIRCKAWFYLSGAHLAIEKYPTLYEKIKKQKAVPSICNEIKQDLHRQFPDHELFVDSSGLGQRGLYNVLKCFSIIRKDIGYCQGMAPVAATLIMQMPPNQAFWTLLSISDFFVPGYYSPGFQAIQLHGAMLYSLLKKFNPTAYHVLKEANIEPILVMLEWFMCLFVRNLPWPTVLRIWDMFLCEGVVIIFKAALTILSTVLKREHYKKDQIEILQLLRRIPSNLVSEKVFIPKIIKLNLTDKQLRQEHIKVLCKLKTNKIKRR